LAVPKKIRKKVTVNLFLILYGIKEHNSGQYSVADTGCLSRIPDLDFFSILDPGSPISDPGPKNNHKSRGKKLVVLPFFSHKFHKIKNYLCWKRLRKKYEQIDNELKHFFP
jgi:hypothetical protein